MSGEPDRGRRQILRFGGLNYTQGASEGELLESEGVSSEQFPCLSQRAGRRTAGEYISPTGIYARGKLCVVDGTDFLYGGKVVGQVAPGEKQFATINTKIVIFPDKVYFDTEDLSLHPLDAKVELPAGAVTFTGDTLTAVLGQLWTSEDQGSGSMELADAAEVQLYTAITVEANTGELALTAGAVITPNGLQRGDLIREGCGEKEYQAVETVQRKTREGEDGAQEVYYLVTYRLHAAVGHDRPPVMDRFRVGDAVFLSGCTTCQANNGSHVVRAVEGNSLTFDRDLFSQTGEETGAVTLERKVPDLAHICQCDNRLWGCEGHTIWASALGDPTNFYVYDGLSTDSYAAAVGTEGEFTACAAYSSTVLFWKEDCVHKVLGSYPAQYEIYTYKVPGVQQGAEKSLAVINEVLYYKGRSGVYAYTGGAPELLSGCFGTRRFTGGAAGTDGERYYISMKDGDGTWGLYVLDTHRGIWLREDDTHAVDWAYLDGKLYYLDADTGKVMTVGQDRSEEGSIPWSTTLCPFHETTHGKKGYSRLFLRADLEAGAWVKAEISADGAPFKQVYLGHEEHARTVQIPILPTRCDSFRVRLSGKGECIIKSFIREFTVGSEY